jgi:hypothetical protein
LTPMRNCNGKGLPDGAIVMEFEIVIG